MKVSKPGSREIPESPEHEGNFSDNAITRQITAKNLDEDGLDKITDFRGCKKKMNDSEAVIELHTRVRSLKSASGPCRSPDQLLG